MKKKGRETFIFRVASPGLRRRAGKSLYLCNCVRQLYLLLFSFFFCPVPSACCPFPINWMLYMLNTRRRSRRTDKESPCRHISLLPSFSTNRRTTRIIIHPNAILVGKKKQRPHLKPTRKVFLVLDSSSSSSEILILSCCASLWAFDDVCIHDNWLARQQALRAYTHPTRSFRFSRLKHKSLYARLQSGLLQRPKWWITHRATLSMKMETTTSVKLK